MMKLSLYVAPVVAVVALVSAVPYKRDVDPSLVPAFGVTAGVNPTGTGDCDGTTNSAGKVVKIPCSCPPDRASFLQSLNANVNAGKVLNNTSISVTFPTDDSMDSQLARLQSAIVTLQNLNGPGIGCPAASTTFLAQQQAIQGGTSITVSTTSTTASVPAPTSGIIDTSLVPEFGVDPGVNPTGTGDCDGTTGATGQVVKIPCSCPPNRDAFIQSLEANVAAGFVVNNPSVKVSFPEDNSKNSQLSRLQTAIVTLQNLNGSGKGCPATSTTFLAQQKAIQDGTAAPTASPAISATAPIFVSFPAPTTAGVPPALVPEFGHAAGLNPTGTGDCDGITNDAGAVVKVPCSCPPDRDTFISSLNANVAVGHVVNNPPVLLTFPADDSKASNAARINAALVTLQNLNGPGVGCPAASTTFLAQLKAVQG